MTRIELRNFYTNEALAGDTVYVNQNKVILDSYGQFSIPITQDSIFIDFLDFLAYSIQIEKSINPGFLLVYQFDKYILLATSIYVRHNYFFGLIKRYTYEGGPDEESNSYDIFRNRDNLNLLNEGLKYHYSSNSKYKDYLILTIEKE